MLFLSTQMIRSAEEQTMKNVSELCLIENAAAACYKRLQHFSSVCIFCGKGNNGSDGYAAAMLLHKAGKRVEIVQAAEPGAPCCVRLAEKCAAEGIPVSASVPIDIDDFECILDAIFGIGISGTVPQNIERLIGIINAFRGIVIAADIPSGMNADTGEVCGACVRADETLTFTAPKTGMLSNESVNLCGEITVCEVGIPVNYSEFSENTCVPICDKSVRAMLPERSRRGHKGTFGTVVMICGSFGMAGAAAMAARSAYKSGCGLVKIIAPRSICQILNIMAGEAVVIPCPEKDGRLLASLSENALSALRCADSVLIGCGLGGSGHGELIKNALAATGANVIIDADGINSLCGRLDIIKNKNVLLTPHPLEFSRISGLSVEEIEKNRINTAESFAREYGIRLLLKGARTVIAYGGSNKYVSLAATSALAKAGSGDILSGIIASLCAQGLTLTDSAAAGCCIHGNAGLLAERKIGVYGTDADDIIANIPPAIEKIISRAM